MPRIDPVADADIDPTLDGLLAEARDRLPDFLNQIRTLAHHPPIARDLVTLYLGFQNHSRVDRRLIELAVVTVSYANLCTYCVSHHTPLLLETGISEEALADLWAGEAAESVHFGDVEKLVVAYALQVTEDARRVPRSMMEALKAHFGPDEIVELTVRIGLANFFNRLNDALQIEIEPGVEPILLAESEEE